MTSDETQLEKTSLWQVIRPYRGRALWGVFLLLCNNGIEKSVPLALKLSVDGMAAHNQAEAMRGAWWVIGLAAVMWWVRAASRIQMFNVGRDVEYALRSGSLRAVHAMGVRARATMEVGDLLSRSTQDLGQVRLLVGFGGLHLVNTVFAYTIAVSLMVSISPVLALVTLAPFPLFWLVTQVFGRRIFVRSRVAQQELAALSSRLHEYVAGIRLVRSLSLEGRMATHMQHANDAVLAANMRLVVLRGLLWPVLMLITSSATLLCIWRGGVLVLSGELTAGELTAFYAYVGLLVPPTMAFGWVLTIIQRGRVSLARILEIIDRGSVVQREETKRLASDWMPSEVPCKEPAPGSSAESPAAAMSTAVSAAGSTAGSTAVERPRPAMPLTAPSPAAPLLDVHELSFAYDESDPEPVLRGVSFGCQPGELVAIVGRTGSGKSTLAQLVGGGLRAAPGAVRVWGRDVALASEHWVRSHVLCSDQDPFLFSRSIEENVRFGNDVSEEALRQMLTQLRCLDELENLPEGLRTKVGQRGIQLSGGQRQRVVLARALLREVDLLLLDDPMSAVDAETAESLGRFLRDRVGRGPTASTIRPSVGVSASGAVPRERARAQGVLVITHQVELAKFAHRIVVLESGSVVGQGTHEALLHDCPAYLRMAREGLRQDSGSRQDLDKSEAASTQGALRLLSHDTGAGSFPASVEEERKP